MKGFRLVHACGGLLACLCAGLTVFSFQIDPTGTRRDIVLLLALLGAMAACYAAGVRGIAGGRARIPVKAVLAWAAVFRLLLFPSRPILETDYYRYLWDGFVLSRGFNPYQFSPDEVLSDTLDSSLHPEDQESLRELRMIVGADPRARAVLEDVNNPEIVTIYPPFAQILFGLSAWLFPLSLYGWRLLVLIFDALLIAALVLLLLRYKRDPAWILLYAWSPLALKEIINTLHFDGIALALGFTGIWLASTGRNSGAVVGFACAALTKIMPLAWLPLWWNRLTRKAWGLIVVLMGATFFAFSGVGARGLRGWVVFAQRWESNSSLVAFFEWAAGKMGVPAWGEGPVVFSILDFEFPRDAFFAAKLLAGGIFLAVWVYQARSVFTRPVRDEGERLARAAAVTGAALICSPVCNPWYVVWMLPFQCFAPRISWLYLSVSCLLYYTFFISDPRAYPAGIRELEYLPFFGMLAWEWWKKPCAAPQENSIPPTFPPPGIVKS